MAHDLKYKRILLVEDDAMIGFDVAETLTEAGAHVIGPCASLADAVDAASTSDIDLAILDIDLGGELVFPAARRLLMRHVPFIFHTGFADRDPLRTEFSAVPVCTKPTPLQVLMNRLEALLPVAA